MKIKIIKKLHEGSLEDQVRKILGSKADDWDQSSITSFKPINQPVRNNLPYQKILLNKGYLVGDEIGKGNFGSVFLATDPIGREVAIKVMFEGAIGNAAVNREMKNYQLAQQARKQSGLVAKHFPKVYDLFKENRFGFIVMEVLSNKGVQMNLVKDIFQGAEGLVGPHLDSVDRGAYKDVRRRMFTFLTNDTSRNKIIDNLLQGLNEETKDTIKQEMSHLPFLQIPAFEAGKDDELYFRILNRMNKTFLSTARDAFVDSFGELKKEFMTNPGLLMFIIKIMEIIKEKDLMYYYQNNIGIAMQWTNFLRQGSPIGIHNRPEVSRIDRAGAPPEVGDSLGEAASIRKAIEELERLTGLAGRDMHEGNVMVRKYTGDIVIVDLGLFKPRSEVVEETIEKDGSKWVVKSEKSGRKFGTYKTKKEAEERLDQIEMFKHMKEEKLDEKKKRKIKKKKNKICKKGIEWAKDKFDTYPSVYANMAASKYCKDPNYGKGKKNESLDEGELQNWVDEKWVRITSTGKIAGECGTSKDTKNPDRCLPKKKAQSLSKKERAATAKKKKQAQKSGKDSGKTSNVKNTKKAKVTKAYTKRQ